MLDLGADLHYEFSIADHQVTKAVQEGGAVPDGVIVDGDGAALLDTWGAYLVEERLS